MEEQRNCGNICRRSIEIGKERELIKDCGIDFGGKERERSEWGRWKKKEGNGGREEMKKG